MVQCYWFQGVNCSVANISWAGGETSISNSLTSTCVHAYPCISLPSVGYVLIVPHTTQKVCECGWELGVRPLRSPPVTTTLVFLPLSATLLMSTPCSVAMKPSTENTTKPAKKLVPLLIIARINASLQKNGKRKNGEWERKQWLTLWAKGHRESGINIL